MLIYVKKDGRPIMDRNKFLKYLNSTKAMGHLLIANLALLSAKDIDISAFFADGTSQKLPPIKITDLLRKIQKFEIYSFDTSIKYSFDLEPAIKLIEESRDKKQFIHMFFNMALQIPILRAFELIKFYCRETNQKNKFQKQDWYKVAYAIRNCLSHNFRIEVYGSDVNDLPFTWGNIAITREMLDKPISYADIKIGDFADLLTAMIASGKDYD